MSEKNNIKQFLLPREILLFLCTTVVGAGAAFFYGRTDIETAGIVILAAAGAGAVSFVLEQSLEKNYFLFDNKEHIGRFICIYLIFLVGSVLFPKLPQGGWPYLAVFVGLSLFGNQMLGLTAGCELLMITVLLSEGNSILFFVYFIAGLTGCIVFSCMDRNFMVRGPLLVSLLVQAVVLSVLEVLGAGGYAAWQTFIIPAVNTFVCFIFLMVLLKAFNYLVITRRQNMLLEINDPEYRLLAELRIFSEEEYNHALHTAYLCSTAASGLGLDAGVVKACGYYHRIGLLKGDNNWENMQMVLEEHHFPQEVLSVLEEYVNQGEKIVSKEAAVLLFCDTIESSLNYLFLKKLKTELDYQKIVGAIFKNKAESGMIDNSSLSFSELQKMKTILTEEKLYHDFLR